MGCRALCRAPDSVTAASTAPAGELTVQIRSSPYLHHDVRLVEVALHHQNGAGGQQPQAGLLKHTCLQCACSAAEPGSCPCSSRELRLNLPKLWPGLNTRRRVHLLASSSAWCSSVRIQAIACRRTQLWMQPQPQIDPQAALGRHADEHCKLKSCSPLKKSLGWQAVSMVYRRKSPHWTCITGAGELHWRPVPMRL